MKRILMSALMLSAVASFAATPGAVTVTAAAAGPYNQTDPHISGSVIAYTDDALGVSRIYYVDASTAASGVAVPSTSPTDSDLLSDISGNTIVFTRSSADGANNIYRYTVGDATATAVDFQAFGERTNASVGSGVVAFEDTSAGNRNIVAANLDSTNVVPLTTSGQNFSPAVSPTGAVIAYLGNCTTTCDVTAAVQTGTTWTTTDLGVNSDGALTGIDTSGATVVYISNGDLAWIPVTGGVAQTYVFAGSDTNPNISGTLVAFEHDDGTQTDIYVKDLSSPEPAVNLTNSPNMSETLNDIYVDGSTVRVVFARPSATGSDLDVYVATAQLVQTTCTFPVLDTGRATCAADEGDDDADEGDDDADENDGDADEDDGDADDGDDEADEGDDDADEGDDDADDDDDECDDDDADEGDADDDYSNRKGHGGKTSANISSPTNIAACDLLWDTATPSATLLLQRTSGKPSTASVSGTDSGDAVVCVRSKASSGSVRLDGAQVLSPSSFKNTEQKFAQATTLDGAWTLSGSISGKPGSVIEARVYSRSQVCPPVTSGSGGGAGTGSGGGEIGGCSTTGTANAIGILAIIALFTMLRPVPADARARRNRR